VPPGLVAFVCALCDIGFVADELLLLALTHVADDARVNDGAAPGPIPPWRLAALGVLVGVLQAWGPRLAAGTPAGRWVVADLVLALQRVLDGAIGGEGLLPALRELQSAGLGASTPVLA
jgi:hypothetical protein